MGVQVRAAEGPMNIEYDIFATYPDSGPIWIESVRDLAIAKEHVVRFNKKRPGNYWIYDASRGQVIFSGSFSAN
jgi:hypothetical protein